MPKRMELEERERIINEVKRLLSARGEVILAVLHGGFLRSAVFRDIDIALYTGHRLSAEEEPSYVDAVRGELEKATGIGVDVQLLEYAPPGFVYNVLSKGKIIVERGKGVSAILRIHALEDLRRIKKR